MPDFIMNILTIFMTLKKMCEKMIKNRRKHSDSICNCKLTFEIIL